MLLIFWKLFCIFIILLNRCNLCVEMMWTSAMHFLYFSHHCFHWLLWYCSIAMLLLVKIVTAKVNCLCLNYIFASSWIKLCRSITFLMTRKQKMMQLIFIRQARISLHVYLIFCIWLLIQLRNVILSCSMFRWTAASLCTFLLSESQCLLFWTSLQYDAEFDSVMFQVYVLCLTVFSLFLADIRLMLQMQFLILLLLSIFVLLLWRLLLM